MSMQESFNMFRKTWIDIDFDALEYNLKHFHNDKKELIFVVKANGYGHGDLKVSKFAYQHCDINWIAVSSLDEAYHIHKHVPELNILVLGYTDYQYIPIAIENNITLIIPSLEYAQNLPETSHGLHVHIKVDTGMNRLGCKTANELQEIINILLSKGVFIDGIFSHFACSDQKDGDMSKKQYNQFKEMVISSNSPEIGKVEEKMIVDSNDKISISFSSKYMLEALKTIKEEDILILLNSDIKPIIIKSVKDESLIQLILPIKTY